MILCAPPLAHYPAHGATSIRQRDQSPAPVDRLCEAQMETDPVPEQPTAHSDVLARALMATVLIAAAIAALAITSLIHAREQATARHRILERSSAPTMHAPSSVPVHTGDVGRLAFGHVEYDWNPTASGGARGYVWPPVARR
jgi:hypothetical protein